MDLVAILCHKTKSVTKQPQSHKWVRIACKALELHLIQQTSKQKNIIMKRFDKSIFLVVCLSS